MPTVGHKVMEPFVTWTAVRTGWAHRIVLAGMFLLGMLPTASAALQFDVFLGYGSSGGGDGYVREAGWFPVGCEVYNDGPSFDAVVEFSSQQLGGGADQTRRMAIELPTNTRKRFVFPVFGGASRGVTWNARLLDSRGKVRAERENLRGREVSWECCLMGAIPRSFGGLPTFPQGKSQDTFPLAPQVARLTVEQFPDNPIALEGLTYLYVSSEKALDLKKNQYEALMAWVHGGGHLIIGVEQAQDVTVTPWMRGLFPGELKAATTVRSRGALQAWLQTGAGQTTEEAPTRPAVRNPGNVPRRPAQIRPGRPVPPLSTLPRPNAAESANLTADPAFEDTEFAVCTVTLGDADVIVSADSTPLAIRAQRGRGYVTGLTFSPDREPFRSWKNRAWFWARLCNIPVGVLDAGIANTYGGWSLDGVFGAMIDTRQVRKLPVEWLLALLVVYLIVIGPLDQWWLKKINRQMLTWLTFPAYVVLFSLLIYYIGYKLRAGETEWNELHLVDILPRAERAELRGRSYSSLYSSVNARYKLASDQPYAAPRNEFVGLWGGGRQSGHSDVELKANGYSAEVSVPVWTSLLYINDWEQPSGMPLAATLIKDGAGTQVRVENHLARQLTDVRLAYQDRLYALGALAPNQAKTIPLGPAQHRQIGEFVSSLSMGFQGAINSRRQAFGSAHSGRLELSPDNVIAASFISEIGDIQGIQRSFIYPYGSDVRSLLRRGDAVLVAWAPDYSPAGSTFRRFTPPRTKQNTLFRLHLPAARLTE